MLYLFVVAMSVSLFYVVKNLPDLKNAILNKILSANLFIYLITEVGGFVSYQKIANEFDSNPYLGFCIVFLSLCPACSQDTLY